ncbi:hypothetical protein ACFQ8W_00435 [Streptomyces sp. NPDC056508]|uniref:hypothetical protein n=1 Tax=Streptomyces sp. NPDC056508 TaxID=3345845 RepID=UPI003689AA7B
MTSRLAEAVQRAAETAVAQAGASWFLATVTAVNSGGTLDITTATGPVPAVRRLKCCTAVVGDNVMVVVNAAGNWLVIDATAS